VELAAKDPKAATRFVPNVEAIKDKSGFLFVLASEIKDDLKEGPVSPKLREAFKTGKVDLSKDAAVKIEVPDDRWLVGDASSACLVLKEEGRFKVYRGVSVFQAVVGDAKETKNPEYTFSDEVTVRIKSLQAKKGAKKSR